MGQLGDFGALMGFYPAPVPLRAKREGCDHTDQLQSLHGGIFEGVVLITSPTPPLPQSPSLFNTGIITTASVSVALSSNLKPKLTSKASSVVFLIIIHHWIMIAHAFVMTSVSVFHSPSLTAAVSIKGFSVRWFP